MNVHNMLVEILLQISLGFDNSFLHIGHNFFEEDENSFLAMHEGSGEQQLPVMVLIGENFGIWR